MILAIANQKGGVGKTTTAINLGAGLGALERRVLLVDSDPQGNATRGLGIKAAAPHLYHVLSGEVPISAAIRPSGFPNLDLVPAQRDLVGIEVELVGESGWEQRLKGVLAEIKDRYDTILLDCPPSLGHLTVNALTAADGILVPLQCEYFALEGISELLATVQRVQGSLNPALQIAGILLTMYDDRTNLSKDVAEEIRSHFAGKVFETVVPRNIRLAEAPSHGLPIFQYDIKSRGRRCLSGARARVPAEGGMMAGSIENKAENKTAAKKRGLGRGLDALIEKAEPKPDEPVRTLPIDRLHPNRFQPRTRFDDAAIEDLAASIRTQGIIQPLVVTAEGEATPSSPASAAGGRPGRRGSNHVPVVVRQVADDRELLELALVENLQRSDLNPIEEAEAYAALQEKFGLSQEEVAARVGKARTTVTNSLRLLRLPDDVLDLLREGRLTAGQARPLLGLQDAGGTDPARRQRRARRALRPRSRSAWPPPPGRSAPKIEEAGPSGRGPYRRRRGAAHPPPADPRRDPAAGQGGPARAAPHPLPLGGGADAAFRRTDRAGREPMIFKSDGKQSDLNGFLDGGSHLQGELRFEASFRVDGKLTGTVESEGDLIVGEAGEVDGEVRVGPGFHLRHGKRHYPCPRSGADRPQRQGIRRDRHAVADDRGRRDLRGALLDEPRSPAGGPQAGSQG